MPATQRPLPELLLVDEVARYLRVHEVTVRRWLADGTMASVKVGGAVRVPRSELTDLLVATARTPGGEWSSGHEQRWFIGRSEPPGHPGGSGALGGSRRA